eukprot:scaffold34414_cov60-Phaeocystis_antarctica.AAC.8
MLVTPDVSKLSGWLNAIVYCRVGRRAYDAGRGMGGEVGGPVSAQPRKRHARGGPDSRLARAERTRNMLFMSVTLDVSKLSGWLNAYATCRVKRRAYDATPNPVGVHREGPTQGCGSQGTRGAHPEHALHGRDLGGVPVGNVRVEILQVLEEVAHVGDA